VVLEVAVSVLTDSFIASHPYSSEVVSNCQDDCRSPGSWS
jgi:hypothetical protein